MGKKHHHSADDIEALREREKIPGPGGYTATNEYLYERDDGKKGKQYGEPPFLSRQRVGARRKNEERNDLETEDNRNHDPARDILAKHYKELSSIESLVKHRQYRL
jgi:hypothetical protein